MATLAMELDLKPEAWDSLDRLSFELNLKLVAIAT